MGCVGHLNFTNSTCPDCGLDVDKYGNTEEQFNYCSYPDCGCDGARLCMAGEASERAMSFNKEGMYIDKNPKAKLEAFMDIYNEKETQA